MPLHKKGKNAVGIGFCDTCWNRMLPDDNIVIIEDEVICETCVEEMDEDGD